MLRFSHCNNDFNSKKLEGTLISIKRGLENKSWYIHTVGFNLTIAKDEICLYILVCKNAHNILWSEDNKEQNTELQSTFVAKKYLHMHKNVRNDIDIPYTVLVQCSGRTEMI